MAVDNRARVLRAATRSFARHGYRISVDDIARRAGVAKQTLYHHFPSKDALFREVARELTTRVLVELEADPGRLREALVGFGVAYRRKVLGTEGLAMFRTLVAEVPRFRASAKALYAGGAGELVRRIAELLEAAMEAKLLRREDPSFAAEQLLSMLAGHERIKRLFGVRTPGETEKQRVGRIVDGFLRAYKPGET